MRRLRLSPAHLSFGNGLCKPFPNNNSENRISYIGRLALLNSRRSFSIYPSKSRRSIIIAKQKTIPELEAEKAENERKLSQLQHKKQQFENRITYYEKGDRHKRTHHLITRGAAIESVAPLTKVLTETEFYTFAEKALGVPEVKGLLMEAVNEHNRAEQKERC